MDGRTGMGDAGGVPDPAGRRSDTGVPASVSFVVMPSVFVGPVSVEPLAEALRGRGHPVGTVDPGAPASATELVERYRAALPGRGAAVLVAHSNAGLFVPGLLIGPPVRGAVLVDALLPVAATAPGVQRIPLVPDGLLSSIPLGFDGGPLAWPFWWDPGDLDGLYPDEKVRREVERRAPRLTAAVMRSPVSVPSLADARGGYVAFGDTYRTDRERAELLGWPTRRLDGHHLHLLVDPVGVAEAVIDVATRAGLL